MTNKDYIFVYAQRRFAQDFDESVLNSIARQLKYITHEIIEYERTKFFILVKKDAVNKITKRIIINEMKRNAIFDNIDNESLNVFADKAIKILRTKQ